MIVETLLRRLEGVRPLGGKRWKACCPAHEDSDPSLAIREADDGRILVHCFAGCSPGDVMAALGLSLADLYPTPLGQALEPLWRDPAYLGLERTVLAVAEADRRKGKRLSRVDLERELAAYRRVREWSS